MLNHDVALVLMVGVILILALTHPEIKKRVPEPIRLVAAAIWGGLFGWTLVRRRPPKDKQKHIEGQEPPKRLPVDYEQEAEDEIRKTIDARNGEPIPADEFIERSRRARDEDL